MGSLEAATVVLATQSKANAQECARAFRRVKAKQLALVGAEQKTKREALDFLHRHFTKLRAFYLRIPATTYQDWIDFGAQADWEECVGAALDEAVWDRLVDRCTREQQERRHG